ncbi:unnamed protein product [Cladocopium goreaui]|uniref:Uncharacterized protein n=1 Tax=Cladocopium goreaui TaxID=2562237 RepID=A0A9P1CJ86_9DINO|nr:unnamed protein product [Cladocopium goreaui]
MPRNWVLLATAAVVQPHEFGTKLPANFINFYEPLSQEELAADLKHLKDGAENGFMLAMPRSLGRLGLTHKSLLDGGSFLDLPGVPGWIQHAAQPFMTQLREFMQLLDWDKQHEESQEDSWRRVEELRRSGKMNQESIQADLSRLEKEKEELDKEHEQLKENLKESRQKEADLKAARGRLEETEREEREARKKLEAERRRLEETERQEREARKKLEAERRRLEEQARQEREARERLEAERRRSWSFSARGDPIICPENGNGEIVHDLCVEYKGPATVMCFDRLGKLQSLDFVGVCDEDGQNCQSPDAVWVGEQWRFDVSSRQFLYRNVAGQKIADVSCGGNWTSEAPSSTPDPKWLDAFNGGRSFILHARQPRITDGPSFDFIWRALMDQRDWDFDSDHIGQWINAMLMAHGFAKEVGFVHETVPLMAQYAVFYGLVASRK